MENSYSIKKLVQTIFKSKHILSKSKVIYDTSKPSGDKKRILNISEAKKFKLYKISNFQTSIDKTILWYKNNIKQS